MVGVQEGGSLIHGRGLFASEDFREGETVLVERPLVAMQDVVNRQESLCCGRCLAFLERQLLENESREEYFKKVKRGDEDGYVCMCGEIFCCLECKESVQHARLCVGKIESESHPLVQYKRLAVESNEILLLVADALINGDRSAYLKFVRDPWDEVVAKARLLRGQVPKLKLSQSLRDLCHQAATLLQAAGFSHCTSEEVSRMIGLFEQNNIGISRLFEADDNFYLNGYALFALCCTANHSCDPNCHVIFNAPKDDNPTTPLAAHLVANRNIAKGEEITISYIDEHQSKRQRQRATADYGFICACPRCLASELDEEDDCSSDETTARDDNSLSSSENNDDDHGHAAS